MNKTEKLLIGIENVLHIASELVDEISHLQSIEEEYRMLKENLFMSQFTKCEREIFELAIDGLNVREMKEFLHKEESAIKKMRKNIIQKLNVKTIKEAVELYENIAHESYRKFNDNHKENFQKLFVVC